MIRLMVIAGLLLAAVPVTGQSSAQGRATIEIGEVLALQVLPGGGGEPIAVDGAYRELENAVELRILANRDWELYVVMDGPDGRVAWAEGVGVAEPTVWWRAGSDEADTSGSYVRAERSPVLVASGTRGRTEIDVDYRWLDGLGRESEPGAELHFTLSAR